MSLDISFDPLSMWWRVSSPLNCRTLKHVSAFMVICLGGGAGNESVYAEDVPKGRVIILLDWGMCVVGLIV